MKLEQHIADLDWLYVPNPNGGFQCAHWHWLNIPSSHSEEGELYLQIEQGKFCFKISLDNVDGITQARGYWSAIIIEYAISVGCGEVVRPSRLKSGNTMTIATADMNYFTGNAGLFEFDRFMNQIKKYEKILNEVVQKIP